MKRITALILILLLCVCPLTTAAYAETENGDSPEWVGKLSAAQDAGQLFVVAGVGETTAYVSMHEKDENGVWKQIMTTPGFIGKNGLGKQAEGDGRTPVGIFSFTSAFGIAEDPGCRFPYHRITEDDYWSGDQREGFHYNEMVSIKDLPDLNKDDSEHLMDYTCQYQYCLNISYNEDGTPGRGSAVFLHCTGPYKPYTGGCVSIPKEQMLIVMRRVRPDCVVVIDSLKNISPETWNDWGLSPEGEPSDNAVITAGRRLTIPDDYAPELIVRVGEDNMLVSVYEKASVEAARAEGWADQDGAGWLFSIGTVNAEELHVMLCQEMFGARVFAEDAEGRFHVFYGPTDVRLIRPGYAYSEEDMAHWAELNQWANSVTESFIMENDGLAAVTYDNSEPAIVLSRAAYLDEARYEIRTLQYGQYGPLESAGVDAAPFAERLIRNVKYTYADLSETPDGEYIVLYLPEENMRLDFFQADGNYVRCSNGDGESARLFRAAPADGEVSVSGVMQAWVDKLAEANGLA